MENDEAEADATVFETLVSGCLRAVDVEYVMPINLALMVLTSALCKDPKTAREMARAFRRSADSCHDMRGRKVLESLAHLCEADPPTEPDALLRLVPKEPSH
jgi:hypothetical protein